MSLSTHDKPPTLDQTMSEPSASAPPAPPCVADEHFRTLFESLPGMYVVLSPQDYRILEVSHAYLQATMRTIEDLRGKPLLEAFPDDPADAESDATHNLRASLDSVRQTGTAQIMAVQRYPIPRPSEQGGGFEERFWSPINSPVKDAQGNILYIVHRVEDVTEYVRMRQGRAPAADDTPRLTHIEADIITRAQEIQTLNAQLMANQAILRMASQLGRLGGWIADLSRNAFIWSDEMRRIAGVPSGYTPTFEDGFLFYTPETRGAVHDAINACVHKGTEFDLEAQITTYTGHPIWVRVMGEPVADKNGNIIRIQGALQDISLQKAAELSIARSEARFRQHADTLPFILWTATPDGAVDYANRTFLHFAGLAENQATGSGWSSTIHPDDFQDSITEWQKVLATGAEYEVEFRIRRASDGAYRWHAVRAVPVRNEDGSILRWLGSAIDVHANRMAEAEQRALAQRLSNTLESIGDGFLTISQDWRFTYINAQGERLLGYSRTEILNQPVWEKFPEAKGSRFQLEYERAIRDQVPVEFDEFFPPLNAWIHVRAYPVPEGLAIYFQNINDRLENERRLREQAALLNKAQDAILVRDLNGNITFWNHGAERLYGWSAQEAVGKPIVKLIYNQTHQFESATRHVLEHGEWSGELNQVQRSGQEILVQGRWSLVRDDHDKPKSILVINTDITERKQLEERVLRAQRMESIGVLAGGIAHDLNNALAPILLATYLLKQQSTAEAMLRQLDIIESSAQRGADMVRQVLTFARGAEGQFSNLNLEIILNEVVHLIRDTLDKNIHLQLDLNDVPWPILGDSTQIHQVLVNLCVNARDAMPHGGRLHVTVENVTLDEQYASMMPDAKPGPHVRITVSDTGIGIPRSIQDKIFDPFFTTKDQGKGTGLGLSTVMGITRSHGGHVSVYSEENRGTSFRIYLPAHPEALHHLAGERGNTKVPTGNGELILVVDDEFPVRTMTQQTLEAFGYRVLLAEDGAEAISIFVQHQHEIALVLTDMMMPIMDGLATIQAILRIQPDTRIIGMSGLGANGMIAKATGVGVRHFLTKPYTAETILNLLAELLNTETPKSHSE